MTITDDTKNPKDTEIIQDILTIIIERYLGRKPGEWKALAYFPQLISVGGTSDTYEFKLWFRYTSTEQQKKTQETPQDSEYSAEQIARMNEIAIMLHEQIINKTREQPKQTQKIPQDIRHPTELEDTLILAIRRELEKLQKILREELDKHRSLGGTLQPSHGLGNPVPSGNDDNQDASLLDGLF